MGWIIFQNTSFNTAIDTRGRNLFYALVISVDFKTWKYLANSTDHLFKQLLYNFFKNLATSLIKWNSNIQPGSDLFFPCSSLTAGKLFLNCFIKNLLCIYSVIGHHWKEPGSVFFLPSLQVQYFDLLAPHNRYIVRGIEKYFQHFCAQFMFCIYCLPHADMFLYHIFKQCWR